MSAKWISSGSARLASIVTLRLDSIQSHSASVAQHCRLFDRFDQRDRRSPSDEWSTKAGSFSSCGEPRSRNPRGRPFVGVVGQVGARHMETKRSFARISNTSKRVGARPVSTHSCRRGRRRRSDRAKIIIASLTEHSNRDWRASQNAPARGLSERDYPLEYFAAGRGWRGAPPPPRASERDVAGSWRQISRAAMMMSARALFFFLSSFLLLFFL